jgi:hypothetical protein
MSLVAQSSEPESSSPVKVIQASDTVKSSAHVSQLLSIANHSGQFLMLPDNLENKVEVDNEARKAARETFVMAHVRLRDLIDEQHRWGLQQSRSEAKATELIETSVELHKSQTKSTDELRRPSLVLNARVRQFVGHGWIAWVGDGLPDTRSLHGVGPSPDLAMKAFDKMFFDIQEIPRGPEKPPEPPPPPSTPKKRKTK